MVLVDSLLVDLMTEHRHWHMNFFWHFIKEVASYVIVDAQIENLVRVTTKSQQAEQVDKQITLWGSFRLKEANSFVREKI